MQQLPPFPDEPGQPANRSSPSRRSPAVQAKQPRRRAGRIRPISMSPRRPPGHGAADNADLARRLGGRSWAEATIASKSGRVAP